ncbi:unnamed protein product [Mesocestoides corti]|uniref:Uncharacterized protein n=1 Tax=Mesocestoides corti TaxID=53468 RepID=A0A0R3UND4_MESCO|nr:unnamed protein product [Mesocestoides corti]
MEPGKNGKFDLRDGSKSGTPIDRDLLITRIFVRAGAGACVRPRVLILATMQACQRIPRGIEHCPRTCLTTTTTPRLTHKLNIKVWLSGVPPHSIGTSVGVTDQHHAAIVSSGDEAERSRVYATPEWAAQSDTHARTHVNAKACCKALNRVCGR